MVGAVVVELTTGIAESQAAVLEQSTRRVSVHNLAMLAENGGKAVAVGQRVGNAIHLSADVALGHTGLDQPLCGGMHHVTHVAGTLNGLYLLMLLR